jgi:hypothetical protein
MSALDDGDDLPPLEDMSVSGPPSVVAPSADKIKAASSSAPLSSSTSKQPPTLSKAEWEKSLEKTDFRTVRQMLEAENVAAVAASSSRKSAAAPPSKTKPAVKEEVEEVDEGEDNLQDALMAAAMGKKSVEEKKAEEVKAAAITKDFGKGGGMKKGFLLGGGAAKKPAAAGSSTGGKSDPITVIKKDPTKEAGVLPEVQEAMKKNLPPGLQDTSQWLTKDLMQQMMANPKLMAGLQNPAYMKALGEMQKDAKTAMEKYKSDLGFQDFLKTYMAAMGEHFTKLGEKEEKEKGKEGEKKEGSGAASKAPSAAEASKKTSKVLISELDEEEASKAASAPSKPKASASSAPDIGLTESSTTKKASAGAGGNILPKVDDIVDMARKGEIKADDEVKAVLSNADLMRMLSDPETQKMMQECAKDGSKLRFYLGIPEMRRRLQMLEKHGLIKLM